MKQKNISEYNEQPNMYTDTQKYSKFHKKRRLLNYFEYSEHRKLALKEMEGKDNGRIRNK
jgi:hypothetical protein